MRRSSRWDALKTDREREGLDPQETRQLKRKKESRERVKEQSNGKKAGVKLDHTKHTYTHRLLVF